MRIEAALPTVTGTARLWQLATALAAAAPPGRVRVARAQLAASQAATVPAMQRGRGRLAIVHDRGGRLSVGILSRDLESRALHLASARAVVGCTTVCLVDRSLA